MFHLLITSFIGGHVYGIPRAQSSEITPINYILGLRLVLFPDTVVMYMGSHVRSLARLPQSTIYWAYD